MTMTGLETVPKPIAAGPGIVFRLSWTRPLSQGVVEADTNYLWSKVPST